MNEPTRLECIARAIEGDSNALQVLLLEHHGSLISLVRAHLPQLMKRHLDPEDVVQEAYVRAFRAVTSCRFDNSTAFQAWLDEVVLSALRDLQRFLRRRKRDVGRNVHGNFRSSDSYAQLFDRVTISDSTPSRKLRKVEAAGAVISSLARLTEDQREVVKLRFLEGWAVTDVAGHLNKSEAAVHMLCHRGLTALREMMISMSHSLSNG